MSAGKRGWEPARSLAQGEARSRHGRVRGGAPGN